jgi:hypothetical protein
MIRVYVVETSNFVGKLVVVVRISEKIYTNFVYIYTINIFSPIFNHFLLTVTSLRCTYPNAQPLPTFPTTRCLQPTDPPQTRTSSFPVTPSQSSEPARRVD